MCLSLGRNFMLKNAWVKAVHKPGISFVKRPAFCTLSTAALSNFLHEAFFVRTLSAVCARRTHVFTQGRKRNFHLMGGWFSSFSTMPIIATNKLFKGLVT